MSHLTVITNVFDELVIHSGRLADLAFTISDIATGVTE